MKKLFLVLAGSFMFTTPAMAHKNHHIHYYHHRSVTHNHCHYHHKSEYSHCHKHSHNGPGKGHHGKKWYHGTYHPLYLHLYTH